MVLNILCQYKLEPQLKLSTWTLTLEVLIFGSSRHYSPAALKPDMIFSPHPRAHPISQPPVVHGISPTPMDLALAVYVELIP